MMARTARQMMRQLCRKDNTREQLVSIQEIPRDYIEDFLHTLYYFYPDLDW